MLLYRFGRRVALVLLLLGYLFFEAFLASYRLALFSLHPASTTAGIIIGYDYELEHSLSLLSLATLITLTPGTISLSVDSDRRCLYVHCLSTVTGQKQQVVQTISRLERFLRWIES